MNSYELMQSGQYYIPMDPELRRIQCEAMLAMDEYNRTRPTEREKRAGLIPKMLGKAGEKITIETPIYCNWGGKHLDVGNNVFINFNLVCVDDEWIHIGDDTLIGPNVTLITGHHPLDPALRAQGLQKNLPIHIGKNCWLCAGVIVCQGVTIGDNTVVAAGSVVTRHLPANVLAMGSPCRPVRSLTDEKLNSL